MADATNEWAFLSNNGTVLLSLASDPAIEVAQIAELIGASEVAVRQIVGDLVAEGYVVHARDGQTARYEINRKAHLRHPLFQAVEIGPLIDALREQRAL